MVGLQKSPPPAVVVLSVQPGREFSLGAISLVKEEKWHEDMLKQVRGKRHSEQNISFT